MPIVERGEVESVLGRGIVEILPSVQDMMDAPDFAEQEVREVSSQVWQSAAQQVMAGVSVRVGIPDTQLGIIGNKLVSGWEATQKAFEQIDFFLTTAEIANVGLLKSGLLSRATGYAAQALSAAPVIGQVVSLAWSLGQFLYNWSRAKREAADRQLPTPMEFDPEDDQWAYRHGLLATLESRLDWGEIWSPPAYWPGMGLKSPQVAPLRPDETTLFRTELVQGGGWSINPTQTDPNRLGAVPGTDFVHAAITPTTNAPSRVIEVRPDAPKGIPKVMNMGSLRPTIRQQTTWIWSHLEVLGPSMFCIHAEDLAERWHRYLYALRYFISAREMKYDEVAMDPELRKAFGWSKLDRSGKARNVDWPSAWGVDKATPVLACQRLKDRQIAALEVGVGAYVHPDAAALRDPQVRKEYDERKRMMLEIASNPEARLDVDVRNIPDFAYRMELERRLSERPGYGTPQVPLVTRLEEEASKEPAGRRRTKLQLAASSGPLGPPKPDLQLAARPVVSTRPSPSTRRADNGGLLLLGAAAIAGVLALQAR